MREIKFRVWDNSPVKDGFNGLMINHEYIMQSSYLIDALNGKYPIMQFTGLQDKNGVEIYEGDICKTTYYNYVEKNSVFTQIVVFENGTFAVKSIDKETSKIDEWRSFSSLHQFFMPTPNKIEIIGNIHENPELL